MPPSSPHEAILDAVEAKVATLDLDGLENNVQRRLSPEEDWMANLSLPAVVVSGAGAESNTGSDTGTEEMAEPVQIRLVWLYPVSTAIEARLQKLRRRVRLAFQNQPLQVEETPGLLEVYSLTLSPSPVVEVNAQAYQVLSSRLDFAANLWEER